MISRKDENGVDQVVSVYTVEGSAFGELSLMYGKPRAASVVAKTAGRLWVLGRAAFRAVIMMDKQQDEALLEVFRSIPVFQELSLATLQRLCTQCVECSYEKGDVVADEGKVAAGMTWSFCIIQKGVLRLINKGDPKKRQLRAELFYFSTHEIGTKFLEARADTKLKIMYVPLSVYKDILGTAKVAALQELVEKSKTKGKRLQVAPCIFDTAEHLELPHLTDSSRFAMQYAAVQLGEFGYIGVFKDNSSQKLCSIKVLAKAQSVNLRMDTRMLQVYNVNLWN
jgi:hypothetical protein